MNEPLNTSAAREYVGTMTGKAPSQRTLRRWCLKGIRNRCGEVVRLRSRMIGARRYTTKEWVDLFIAELSKDPMGMEPIESSRLAGRQRSPLVITPERRELMERFGFTYDQEET